MSKTRILEMPKVLAQKPFLEFFVGLHNKSVITYVTRLCITKAVSVRVSKNDLEGQHQSMVPNIQV